MPDPRRGPNPPDPPEAVALVRALIDDYPLLFDEMLQQEARQARALHEKVQRLAAVVEETRRPAVAMAEGEPGADPECTQLFKQLFHFLGRVERRIIVASHVTASPSSALQQGMGGVSPPRRHRGGREGGHRHRHGGEAGGHHGRPTRASSASPRLRSPGAAGGTGGGRKGSGAAATASGGKEGEEEDKEREEAEGEEEEDDEGGEPFSFTSPRWEVRFFVFGALVCVVLAIR